MKSEQFIELLKKAKDSKTKYVWGSFGRRLDKNFLQSKIKQYPEWYNKKRIEELKDVDEETFGFDCSGLIKGILWGWNGDETITGGARYASNGIPDLNANSLIVKCSNVSTDFSELVVGSLLWLKGHVGIYIGVGRVIEATPSFGGGVVETALTDRRWVKHGLLPWIEYEED